MDLFLQFGYGMMEHSRQLISSWGGGTVVLSPRDLRPEQLVRLSSQIVELGGSVLVDPQFFLPHSDHERLRSHDYWPDAYETSHFWDGPALRELLGRLAGLNGDLGTSRCILPGLLADSVDDDWLETQRATLEEANSLGITPGVVLTLALSADTMRDESQIARLLEWTAGQEANAYYVVAEHPGGDYLVNDPIWLANALDLIAGLKLQGGEVIVGYCNQQMLVAAAAKADAICSGTWMNVRSFPPAKFSADYQDEIRRRTAWYYCPQTLSEYKVPFLDVAQLQGVLDDLAPTAELDGGYVATLFGGAQPSTVGLTEQKAFRHYLHSLRGQASTVTLPSFEETREHQEQMLEAAEGRIAQLAAKGVRGQKRDFGEMVDVNRAALAILDSTRGPTLRHKWAEL